MEEFDWIKDLISAEQKMEESGMIDLQSQVDEEKILAAETISLLHKLKDLFIDYTTVYNKLRAASVGGVKIYGISKTVADFMVFRNGYKLFFSQKKPGVIAIKVHYNGTDILSTQNEALDSLGQEELIEARWGAFGEVIWTHQEQVVNPEYVVKHFFTKFVKESTR